MLQAPMAVPASLGSVSIGHPLRSLVYDRADRRVIGISDTEVVIVDATSHRVLARRSLTFSATSNVSSVSIANGPGDTVAVIDVLSEVRLLDAATLRDVAPPIELAAAPTSFGVTPDGSTLAAGDGFGSVAFYDLRSREKIGELQVPAKVVGLAFSTDGTHLVVGEPSAVSMATLTKGGADALVRRHVVDGLLAGVSIGDDNTIVASWTPDGGEAAIAVIDAASGVQWWRAAMQSGTAAALSSGGPGYVLAADAGGVRRIDLTTGDAIVLGLTAARTARLAADGRTFVAATDCGSLTFWSTDGRELLARVLHGAPNPCRLQSSTTGRFVACSNPARIWDLTRPSGAPLLRRDSGRTYLFGASNALLIDATGAWSVIDLNTGSDVDNGTSSRLGGGGSAGIGSGAEVSSDGRLLAHSDRTKLVLVDYRMNVSTVLLEPGPG